MWIFGGKDEDNQKLNDLIIGLTTPLNAGIELAINSNDVSTGLIPGRGSNGNGE